jgi:4-hydroxybenzoate polyprenyltransferase
VETVRPAQTLFAMPFAYMALFLAEGGWPRLHVFIWISLAFIGARLAGMALNRVADTEIDRKIPRNARRPLPSGRLKKLEVGLFIAASLALFVGASWQLGDWPRRLWPAVVAALVISPYIKRFFSASNFSIGMVYLLIPSGVWVASRGEFGWPPVLLGLAAALWNTGFDTIYRTQDAAVDRSIGLHSLSADFGVGTALLVAKLLHVGMMACLVTVGLVLGVGVLYWVGLGVAAGLFVYQHSLVKPGDLSRIGRAFFTMTSMISVTLFVFVALDMVT